MSQTKVFRHSLNEMLLELASGADFGYVLHHFSGRTHLEGSWGPIWAENDRKSIFVSYDDRYQVFRHSFDTFAKMTFISQTPVAQPRGGAS